MHETSVKNLFFNKVVDNKTYELPDDQPLVISREYYDIPELLFKQPDGQSPDRAESNEFLPIPQCIIQAKEKIPGEKRRDILSNIILAGGTSNLVGIADRIQKVLSETQEDNFIFSKIKICGNKLERQHSSWLGASVIASMNLFNGLQMTKQEYEEHGAYLIDSKCN